MVNCLYNIVDQIFIGHAVGIKGVAATNVTFPIGIIAAALALLIGDGCAANVSLHLGRGEQEEADRDVYKRQFLMCGFRIQKKALTFYSQSLILRLQCRSYFSGTSGNPWKPISKSASVGI